MIFDAPDLSQVSPEVLTYIRTLEAEISDLEAEIENLRRSKSSRSIRKSSRSKKHSEAGVNIPTDDPSEAPTSLNLISFSQQNQLKRTPRHLYNRQRRGGMGIFDLETPEDDHPHLLTVAEADSHLILISNTARAFRLRVGQLTESDIRSRGESLADLLPLQNGEFIACTVPEEDGTNVALLTERGHVRLFRASYFGSSMHNGLVLYDTSKLGQPSAACWADGREDIFIATRKGRGIRFPEKLVPVRGCLGISLKPDDKAVGITTVSDKSGVFMLTEDGKGTIREMANFRANKSPGAQGKVAMKSDLVIGAQTASPKDDVFAISELGKLIRFPASDVPSKSGTVQGVNCMALRADTVTAMLVCPPA